MTLPPDLAGKTLGDYVLLNKLTSGGMAHIYIGQDSKLGRKAAIKVLTPDMAGNDDMLRDRFQREAKAIANLEHDSIVPVYQFGQDEGENLYFIAMRYIEGLDLADEMKAYKKRGELMPSQRWIAILEQIAGALDYAHRHGIIHRDIKPSNILVGENDKAILSDFGLVLWEAVDQTLGTAFGTPRYISPEQATDSQSAVPQSDLYSLAVIVYELATGQMLFTGSTPMEVALSHITEQPTPPRAHNPAISPKAQNEIMKALQKDPNKRHRTATEFIEAIKNAYENAGSDDYDDYDDVSTMPLRDDELAESTQSILDEWEKIPSPQDTGSSTIVLKEDTQEDKKTPPEESPTPRKKRRSRVPAYFSALVLLFISVPIYYYGFMLGYLPIEDIRNLDFQNIQNSLMGSDGTMELRYNDNFFAVVNAGQNTLDISQLEIIGRINDETPGSDFGDSLEPGACVFVRRANVTDADIPESWGCEGSRRAIINNPVFWRADDAESDTNFSVQRGGGREVSECPTHGTAVGRTGDMVCNIIWPDTIGG